MIPGTPKVVCDRCGKIHPRCSAHNKAGNPCGQVALKYQAVCRVHGGRSPFAIKKAEERRLEYEARAQATKLGLPRDIGPAEALLEEVKWTAGHVAWLRSKVQELETEKELIWGITESSTSAGTDKDKYTSLDNETHSAGMHMWYRLYDQERKHLVAVCAAALRAGVEERRVRLAENQGQAVAAVISRILDLLQLTDQQRELVPQVVPSQLRLLAQGEAIQ